MSSDKEVLGRVVIAEFEARKKAEKQLKRAAGMRFAFQILISIAAVVFAVLVVRQTIQFSTSDWAYIICALVITTGWSNFQLRENVAKLKAEVERLKAKVNGECGQTRG